MDSIDPLWLSLYGEKKGQEVRGLGEIKIAIWFSHSGAMEGDHKGESTRAKPLSPRQKFCREVTPSGNFWISLLHCPTSLP